MASPTSIRPVASRQTRVDWILILASLEENIEGEKGSVGAVKLSITGKNGSGNDSNYMTPVKRLGVLRVKITITELQDA